MAWLMIEKRGTEKTGEEWTIRKLSADELLEMAKGTPREVKAASAVVNVPDADEEIVF